VAASLGVWWNVAMPTTRTPPVGSSRRPTLRLLKDVPLFSALTRPQLSRVADLAQEVAYGPGRMIVKDGTPGVAFYVITDGRAKVIKGKIATARGNATLGPGDFFGELALLDGGPRSASVVADGAITTIRIERTPFRTLLKDEPDIALKLLEGMARRMRGMTQNL
jgi:CRP/FNR family transcriptional regulator, cyclic AMP receptor protein